MGANWITGPWKLFEFVLLNRSKRRHSPEKVIKVLGFSRGRIYEWLARYRSAGWHALRAKPLKARPRRITGNQMKWIYNTVTLKIPLQYKFEFALWTRRMIQDMIVERYKFQLSLTSAGRLLAQLGLTCQKPLMRAFQQNPSLVEQWLKEGHPRIRARAKRIGAEIFFADEAGGKCRVSAEQTILQQVIHEVE